MVDFIQETLQKQQKYSDKKAWHNSLARRLMLWILVISVINTLIAASVQLVIDYKRELISVTQQFDYIEKNLVSALAEASYAYDINQIEVQLQGLYGSPYIAGAMVRFGPQNRTIKSGTIALSDSNIRQFPLKIINGQKEIKVGNMYLVPDLQAVYTRTLNRARLVLLTQTLIIFIVSFSLLFVFSKLITRHLRHIANFVHNFSPSDDFKILELKRKPYKKPDELDDLVNALNESWLDLKSSRDRESILLRELEDEVIKRTAALENANRQLSQLSTTDALTSLANRRKFDQVIDAELKRAQRNHSDLVLGIVDVDNFKKYNDHYGHLEGDWCLQKIAEVLKEHTRRPNDLAARYGGEEFALILADFSQQDAEILAESIRRSVEDLQIPNETDSGIITISIGLCSISPSKYSQVKSLIENADSALYKAKNAGRNQVQSYQG